MFATKVINVLAIPGSLPVCCSGSTRAKPCASASAPQPEPARYVDAAWVQPCSTTTSGASLSPAGT
jgi:hypothetical protein